MKGLIDGPGLIGILQWPQTIIRAYDYHWKYVSGLALTGEMVGHAGMDQSSSSTVPVERLIWKYNKLWIELWDLPCRRVTKAFLLRTYYIPISATIPYGKEQFIANRDIGH